MRKLRILGYIILVALVILIIYSVATSYKKTYTGKAPYFSQPNDSFVKGSYDAYVNKYANESKPKTETIIDIKSPTSSKPNSYKIIDNYIITSEEAFIEWTFSIPETGLYQIYITYKQVIDETIEGQNFRGKSGDAERILKINGENPFNEAKSIRFSRIWEDDFTKGRIFVQNSNGDEIRPKQIEKPIDVSGFIDDYEVREPEPYYFYFESGSNTLSFESVREPLIIKELVIKNGETVNDYETQVSLWKKEGLDIAKGKQIKHEAEYMYEKNTPVLIPLLDQTSSKAYPYYDGNRIRLNSIGIYSWRLPGYWVSYKINAPEDGLYALTIKGKQDIKSGSPVSRQILINGEIPFKEASYITFKQNGSLDNYHIGTKKEPYLFKLNKGENTIQFKISLASISDVLSFSNELMKELNTLYLRVIEYTSASPDLNRDYNIKDQEHIVELIETNYNLINKTISLYKEFSKNSTGRLSVLNSLLRQVRNFKKNPERIVFELNSFQTNISALGTWVLEEQEQPFTMDSFTFHDPKVKVKRARANIFETAWYEYVKFIASFAKNKTFSGSKKSKKIKVWITSGRDNAQILRRIIDDEFDSDIQVDLELVQVQALLRATISGKGPDVALSVPEGTPIDFAFRGAAYDLNNFKDKGLSEVENRFYESALGPFRFNSGLYALPEQQMFPVLFYRKDIFERLNIEIPTTREELYNAVEVINSNNFNFYVDSGASTMQDYMQMTGLSNSVNAGFFTSVLYQYGAELYRDDYSKTALTEKSAMKAFTEFTDFFTVYKVPVQANFVNRFRSGEIAAGIIDYSNYNTLAVFAPEIAGNWAIAKVPTLGTKDVVASKSNAASMMLQAAKDKESSWEFLKWWTSTETQVLYAREMETIMGAAARYTTANHKALEKLSWPSKDLAVISEQLKRTQGTPQIPGGYMTTRQFNYAFHSVIRGEPAFETMSEYSKKIDEEIRKKREEFNLN